jgi:hypothetical protein
VVKEVPPAETVYAGLVKLELIYHSRGSSEAQTDLISPMRYHACLGPLALPPRQALGPGVGSTVRRRDESFNRVSPSFSPGQPLVVQSSVVVPRIVPHCELSPSFCQSSQAVVQISPD